MSKYAPLAAHLKESERDSVAMTFKEVEATIGKPLPPSAYRHRSWWSNNPNNNTSTRAWLDAGYKATEVDMKNRKLSFRKAPPEGLTYPFPAPSGGAGVAEAPAAVLAPAPPGALAGTVTVMAGTDLTDPLDEKWEAAE